MSIRLRCGNCKEVVRLKERIFLDELNTVIHQKCYSSNFAIKDRGTFREIIERHSFFEDLRPHLFIVK